MKNQRQGSPASKSVPRNVLKLFKSSGIRLSDILTSFLLIAVFLLSATIIMQRDTSSSTNLLLIETSKEKKFFKPGGYRLVNARGEIGVMTIEIADDSVKVVDSPCKDKYCMKQGEIDSPGESIICLPGKVKITIQGGTFTDSINR